MNTRRRLIALLAAFAPTATDGRFVAVAYMDGEVKVRLITGKVWAVPIHPGCNLVIGAVPALDAMPMLASVPDSTGTYTADECRALYAPPGRRAMGTVGP